ncbi:DUF4845 domain-containing protein [Porticoccus sp. W117]|uniref:DUF4845 domain-containing protein n=1 Tax=Porticoccus sp. W117 TaxID=3054777 RepID=UPI002591E22A|nr:DUF4845 domain-containing protein [Porticoccus sp. W117]MDM3869824.1 DUF4845 domain-containing protein [Porticoccus sp. W117]
MKSVKSQRGMSSLGLLLIIGIAAFFLLCAFRVGPLYLDDSFVGSSLDKLRDDDLENMSNSEIRSQISRYFTVDGVRDISTKQIKIDRKRDTVILTLDYEKRVEFLGNLDVAVRFSHKIDSSEGKKK